MPLHRHGTDTAPSLHQGTVASLAVAVREVALSQLPPVLSANDGGSIADGGDGGIGGGCEFDSTVEAVQGRLTHEEANRQACGTNRVGDGGGSDGDCGACSGGGGGGGMG